MTRRARIEEALENLLSEFYAEEKISAGDITPEQEKLWSDITEATDRLFSNLIAQNKGV